MTFSFAMKLYFAMRVRRPKKLFICQVLRTESRRLGLYHTLWRAFVSRCRYSAEKKVVGDNTDYTLKIKRARFTRPFGKQLVNGFGPNSSCSLFCLKHGSHFYPKEVHTPLDVRTCLFRWLVFLPQALLLFSALQHPRNFSVQFGTVRFVNRPFWAV